MDYSFFLQQLHEAIQSSTAHGGRHKHIIRFNRPGQYRECLSHLQKMKSGFSGLRRIQAAHSIRALIAPAACRERLERFQDRLVIERDSSVRIHKSSTPQIRIEPEGDIPWGIKQIRAPRIWPISTGSRVRIGIIDTGVDFQHPDLQHALARGVNLLNRALWPYDDNGHGTHIAGTIASINSQSGLMGVAPHTIIYPVKAFDHNGSAYVSDIVLGIDWCVRNQVHIINMSFGMKTRSKALLDVVNRAHQSGITIVASSGNDGKRSSIDYPARYPQTIAVGATDRFKRVATFSNRGPYVDVYAPGDKIISSWIKGRHHEMSGTSMATSHVSGAIALLLAQKPDLSPSEIKALLRKTSSPIRSPKGATRRTSKLGEIDAYRLLQEGLK